MKLIVQGKQMRITEGMRRFAEQHVVRPLRRFYDDEAAELRVELGRENGNRGESTECHLTFACGHPDHPDRGEHADPTRPRAGGRSAGPAAEEGSGQEAWSKGRHKHHPLATVVAEGGVPAACRGPSARGRAFAASSSSSRFAAPRKK